MAKGTDLDDVATGGSKRDRITDRIPLYKFPEKKWVTLRLFGAIFTTGGYWVKSKNKEGKKITFYVPSPSYNSETQQREAKVYDPWRDFEATEEGNDRTIKFAKAGFMCAISRKAQKNAPAKSPKPTATERKTGFKEMDSDTYTPWVPVRFPFSVIGKLKELKGINTVEVKGETKAFPVTHQKYGCDVKILYDSSKPPANQYEVQMGGRTKISEEELEALKYDLTDLETADDKEETKRNFERWAKANGIKTKKKARDDDDDEDEDLPDDDGDDEDEDEDDEPKSKKKSKIKAKTKGKSKSRDDEDDDDEDLDDIDLDDDEDDDEPKSKSKKSKSKPKKSKSRDDDDEDEDLDDEEEEEEPKSKSKKKSKKSKDDDLDDLDDLDDDDDEDEPKSKSKKKSKSRDEDEEEDLDDDEDEPKSKKKKVKGKAKTKSKKSRDDEDDEEDDDLDDLDEDDEEEEEEDDEPKSKKKKRK